MKFFKLNDEDKLALDRANAVLNRYLEFYQDCVAKAEDYTPAFNPYQVLNASLTLEAFMLLELSPKLVKDGSANG